MMRVSHVKGDLRLAFAVPTLSPPLPKLDNVDVKLMTVPRPVGWRLLLRVR